MAANDEAQVPTKASKATRSVSIVIRAVRVLTAACLVVGAVALSFVSPFLFDSPNASPALILAIIISFPLSFLLSAAPYKQSLAQGNLTNALLFGTAPLLLIAVYVGIAQAVDKLTPEQNPHVDATIQGGNDGQLFIKTPAKCRPSIRPRSYSIHGAWKADGDKINFACDGTPSGRDSLVITEAGAIPSVESVLTRYTKLVESDRNSESYRYVTNDRTVAEITKFTTYDGHQAFVGRWTSSGSPTYRRISRRLDDTFELTYGMHQETGSHTDMVEADRRIAEYVKSIAHRNK